MGPVRSRWSIAGGLAVVCTAACLGASAQVFTVGEKTATADIKTDFSATHVELPTTAMTERGRRELMRDLQAEQGFAHRVLPLGGLLTLQANGNLTPGADSYKKLVYQKGQAAAAGDRVAVTALEVKGDRIVVDFNGGPYVKHRFLRHLQVGMGGAATPDPNLQEQATGWRITLLFEGQVPEVSAPEVKALLLPLVDFGVKTSEQAYADTLPEPVKQAIASHEVLVGMSHRMVLAAAGQPENKVRESIDGTRYEEWIYGHQPQTVKFVRFTGDRVTLVKIAKLGKSMEIHDHAELAELAGKEPASTRTVLLGDVKADSAAPAGPPSLMKPGEQQELPTGTTQRRVQFPNEKPATSPPTTPTTPSNPPPS